MIAKIRRHRIGTAAVAIGTVAVAASGLGCPSVRADTPELPVSPPINLLSFSPDDVSALNELAPAAQVASSDAVDPLAATSAATLWSELLALINGASPAPSTAGDFVGFSGEPSLLESAENTLLTFVTPFENLLGVNLISALVPAINSPPLWLTTSDGITVTDTQYDGMPVYELTPEDPSGQYVVAIHGGAYVEGPSIEHWLNYTDMAHETGATVVVPIYPLATEGATAGTVEPEIASLISSEIATEGASHVSVLGDSAGGGIALSAVELLVSEGKAVPDSMVLDSPTLDAALDNPNISLVDDPILNVAQLQADGQLWAGDLPLNDPLVSPIYGSLEGLPSTYVYSGSDDILAPDVLVLEQDAIAQDAPMSFILRSGEIHDWALVPSSDGAQVQSQIYQELGLTAGTSTAATSNLSSLEALENAVQTLGANLSPDAISGTSSAGELSSELANMFSAASTDLTNLVATMSADATALSADVHTWIADAITTF